MLIIHILPLCKKLTKELISSALISSFQSFLYTYNENTLSEYLEKYAT
jgi:hypothetical protein